MKQINRIKIHAEPSFIWMPFKHYVSAKIKYFSWLGIEYTIQDIVSSVTRVQGGQCQTELDVLIFDDINFD